MEKYITVLLLQGPLCQNFSIYAYFISQRKTLKLSTPSVHRLKLKDQEKIVCLFQGGLRGIFKINI